MKNKGLNDGWRYLLGILIILVVWQLFGAVPILGFVAYLASKGVAVGDNPFVLARNTGISNNLLFFLMLVSFVIGMLGLYVVNKFLHRKKFIELITARTSFSWQRFAFGFSIYGAFSVILFVVSYIMTPDEYVCIFDVEKFIPLLFLSLLFLPIQVGLEELFFRGYLMQGLSAVSGVRLIAYVLPAVIFGLSHGANPEVEEHGFFIMMSYYVGMGLFLGLIAIMDDGLEIAFGVHLINNLLGALLFRVEDSALQTDSIFIVKNYNPIDDIPIFFAVMLIFILISAKVFKWKNWSKLYKNNF